MCWKWTASLWLAIQHWNKKPQAVMKTSRSAFNNQNKMFCHSVFIQWFPFWMNKQWKVHVHTACAGYIPSISMQYYVCVALIILMFWITLYFFLIASCKHHTVLQLMTVCVNWLFIGKEGSVVHTVEFHQFCTPASHSPGPTVNMYLTRLSWQSSQDSAMKVWAH